MQWIANLTLLAFSVGAFMGEPLRHNTDKLQHSTSFNKPVQVADNDDEVAMARAAPIEREICVLVNEYRKKKGLSPLKMNIYIIEQCRLHSGKMADKKRKFSHDGFADRIKLLNTKIIGCSAWSENVAYNQATASQVVDAWINSEGHRENLEGDFNLTGVGFVKDKNGNAYYTQMYIKQNK